MMSIAVLGVRSGRNWIWGNKKKADTFEGVSAFLFGDLFNNDFCVGVLSRYYVDAWC